MGPSTKRRKLNTSAVEEIKFDDDARADYLTGFHKRKLARIKEAQQQAAKKEKAERLVMREEVSFHSIALNPTFKAAGNKL
jgi:ribosomal RNA-processing protein 17